MANIFLSYAHGDRRRAEKVAQALERAGHSVWWDQQIHAGSRFSKDIDTALRKADIVDPANALRMIREGEAPPESDEGLYVEARISPTPSNLEAVLTHYRKVYKKEPAYSFAYIQALGTFGRVDEAYRVFVTRNSNMIAGEKQ